MVSGAKVVVKREKYLASWSGERVKFFEGGLEDKSGWTTRLCLLQNEPQKERVEEGISRSKWLEDKSVRSIWSKSGIFGD